MLTLAETLQQRQGKFSLTQENRELQEVISFKIKIPNIKDYQLVVR